MTISQASIVSQRMAMAAAQLRLCDDPDLSLALAARYAVLELVGAALRNYLGEIQSMAPVSEASANGEYGAGLRSLGDLLYLGGQQVPAQLLELRALAEQSDSWLARLLNLLSQNQTSALFSQSPSFAQVPTGTEGGVIATSASVTVDDNKVVLSQDLCAWLYRELAELIQRQRDALVEY